MPAASPPPPTHVTTQDGVASPSSVYYPDAITPQSVAAARAAQQQQLASESRAEGSQGVTQLSDGESARALAQLTQEERQVLLEAVEGTDICDSGSNIPALQALCERRLETRSAEFAQGNEGSSAEDTLLGGRFDSERLATLEAAINRLAQTSASPEDFANQAVASVALGQQGALSDAQATSAEGDPTSDFSPETQAVINAIVQQLGGGG